MPQELSPQAQAELIKTWKWRFTRLGTNATKVAAGLEIHQGNLCDVMNGKTVPRPENFWRVENWIVKQEKKNKVK